MEIQDRPLRSRDRSPLVVLAGAAALAQIVGGQPIAARTPIVGDPRRGVRRPLVGCGGAGCGDCVACDAAEAARLAAEKCLAGGNAQFQQNFARGAVNGPAWMGVDPMKITPSNCERFGLRYVPIGVSNGDAIAPGADSLEIELRANFLPYLHVVTPASTAKSINFTQINYQLQPMLIGGVVNGEMFISTAANGGYRLPTRRWLGNSDVITYNFNALAAYVADALQIMAWGFTDALG